MESGQPSNTKRTTVYLSERDTRYFQAMLVLQGSNLSEWIRGAIKREIDKEDSQKTEAVRHLRRSLGD